MPRQSYTFGVSASFAAFFEEGPLVDGKAGLSVAGRNGSSYSTDF